MENPARARRYSFRFPSTPLAIPLFEDWLEASGIPGGELRNRVKLAGEEILDNLIRHSRPLEGERIRARLRVSGQSARLSFFFRSRAFREFAAAGGPPRAVYDPRDERWRGLGLFMIAALTRSVRYRPGSILDRIHAEF